MPQQNSIKEKHLIDHREECPAVSEFFYVQKLSEINTADDAAARLVKDDNKCVEIRAGELHSCIHVRPACCSVCPIYEFIYQAHALPVGRG